MGRQCKKKERNLTFLQVFFW